MIQDELDVTVETWDSHKIRPSRNDNVPHGRPNVMFMLPSLYGSDDYINRVSLNDLSVCRNISVYRSSVACDSDVFKLCTLLQAHHGLNFPKDGYEACTLYVKLKELILNTL